MSVTIIPEQCPKCVAFDAEWLRKFGRPGSSGPMRCDACRTLGVQIQDALYEDLLWWTGLLAWNLCSASLLCSAEERGAQRECDRRNAIDDDLARNPRL